MCFFLLLCFRFAPNNKINYSQPEKCSPILSSYPHRPAHNYREWQFKGPCPADKAPGSAKGCMAAKCGINHKSNLLHHFSVLLPRPTSPNGAEHCLQTPALITNSRGAPLVKCDIAPHRSPRTHPLGHAECDTASQMSLPSYRVLRPAGQSFLGGLITDTKGSRVKNDEYPYLYQLAPNLPQAGTNSF